MVDWLQRIGAFPVEQREIPRPGNARYYVNTSTLIGVLHTTEGDTVEGGWETLNRKHAAPHFICGEGRIVQCRPLSAQGAALAGGVNAGTNANAQVQIEMVGWSRTALWLPALPTLEPTLAVLAYAAKHLGIPLAVPAGWPDDVSDMPLPWAIRNRRRRSAEQGLWPREKGWWMHMEVPYQGKKWHWDCGALRRTEMLARARDLINAV